MKNLDEKLIPLLAKQKAEHLYRYYPARSGSVGATLQFKDKNYLAFTSNDYLGLSNHPDLIRTVELALKEYGVGSGAAHGLSGHCVAHEELERALAKFTHRPAALTFSTGFMANLAVISTLLTSKDCVFADRLVHASLLDGVRLSGARLLRYHHNDLHNLTTKLSRPTHGQSLIITDGVFSMDGDLSPLPELAKISQENNACLYVDDAHGFGVLGKNGGGCSEHFNLSENEIPILIGTLSKALGSFGAFVAGSEVLIESLRQWARPFMFSTAIPPMLAEASLTSLHLAQHENWRRERLQELISYFRHRAADLCLPLMPSFTPIQPLLIGDNKKTLFMQSALKEQGILVAAIRPPTVPVNTSRIRMSFNVYHTREDVDKLLQAIHSNILHGF